MSEKYTIVESLSSENNGACWLFKGDVKIASFNFLVEAELVCRLLNEDEKRKSAPRIDRDVQRYIINQIKSTISKAKDEHPYLDFCKYINAIKIIESLECE